MKKKSKKVYSNIPLGHTDLSSIIDDTVNDAFYDELRKGKIDFSNWTGVIGDNINDSRTN